MPVNNIITSAILSVFPELVHGISTKAGGNKQPPFYNNMSFRVGDNEADVKANREEFFGSLDIDPNLLAIPQQVHSDKVKIIDKPGFYPECDGLITQAPDVYLIISTADCYSVSMYDKTNKVIGNIHSGWRGMQKKIVTKAVKIMINDFGSKIEDLLIFIGPGINKENFKVGEDVACLFEKRFTESKNGKYFIDLKAHIIDQLNVLGIKKPQIESYPNCTFEGEDYLHSYRRDGDKSGRMFSVIGLRG